ncbi:MAG: protein tyrosine phosphatase family protein [Caulobacterales bacterium]
MSISDIYNFIQIDGLTATAGQPSADQFEEIADSGYSAVINLAPDGLDTSLPEEAELLHRLGMEYYHIPVAWSDPQLGELSRFESLMASLSGSPTFIHCQANFRVTVFFALYATSHLGWSDEQANALIDRIWTSRPGFEMDDTWKNFVAAARSR